MANKKNEQFLRNLEFLIKCQACDGKLVGPVYLCGSGHSICNACTNKGTVCQCHAPYTKIPNLLIQNLLSQFDNFKVYLQELHDDSDKKSQNSIATAKSNFNDSSDPKYVNKYRCWIRNNCRFIADISTIVRHFRNNHFHQFEEHLKWNFPFIKSYEMNYAIGSYLDCGIKIGKLVFIIHISINDKGELGSCILMYTSREIADQHKCQIQVECDNSSTWYNNAKIVNANAPESVILGFKRCGLQIARNIQLYKSMDKNKRFKCTVMIERKSLNVTNEKKPEENIKKLIPKANYKSKKNHEIKANDDKLLANAKVSVDISEPLSEVTDEFSNDSNVDDPACVLM